MDNIIEIKNLKKKFKKVEALKGINLNVAPGELFAYLGPNGSGKTTTIRILTGLSRATSGTALLNGKDIEINRIESRRQFGLVPQVINLDPELTVRQNLDIHGRLFGMKKSDRKERIEALLGYIDMSDRSESLVKHLSGGLKRRVMVARAMLHSPRIIFLDEPTTGLDPGIRRKIWSLIKKIQQDGTTIFLTTHYIEEAEFLAERVAFLEKGEIVAVNTPASFMEKLGSWAVDILGEDGLYTEFFQSSEDANRFIASGYEGFTKRRVNLEDAFIAITGKKIGLSGNGNVGSGIKEL